MQVEEKAILEPDDVEGDSKHHTPPESKQSAGRLRLSDRSMRGESEREVKKLAKPDSSQHPRSRPPHPSPSRGNRHRSPSPSHHHRSHRHHHRHPVHHEHSSSRTRSRSQKSTSDADEKSTRGSQEQAENPDSNRISRRIRPPTSHKRHRSYSRSTTVDRIHSHHHNKRYHSREREGVSSHAHHHLLLAREEKLTRSPASAAESVVSSSRPSARGNESRRRSRDHYHHHHGRPRPNESPVRDSDQGSRRRSPSPRDHKSRARSYNPVRTEPPSAKQTQIRPRQQPPSPGGQPAREPTPQKDEGMYNRGQYDPRYGHSSGSTSYGQGHQESGYQAHASSPYQQQQYGNQAHSGVGYYQPQPGKQYGSGPRDPFPKAPAARGGVAARGARPPHFANLSWTPDNGTKGGHLVKAGEKIDDTSQLQSVVVAPDPDEDDNPFRPPADLRAEDEHAAKKRKLDQPAPSGPAPGNEKSKISFSIKGRANMASSEKQPIISKSETSPLLAKRAPATISPLVQGSVPKSSNYIGNERIGGSMSKKPELPQTRKEIVRKKRVKPRPELSQEFKESDSVYFRKTGNESVVGSGTYGKVYKAIHVYTGGMVALKKIRMEGERDGFPVTAIREIKLLQSLKHFNVVPLLEVMVERNDCFMVFEYLSHDLTGLLNHPSFALTAAHKKHLAKQLFEGLDYLHRRGVLHRDIKAANILISKTGELKLADFGLARFYQKRQKQDYTNRVITIWYRSPELLLGETQYGPGVDIWSAACVLVEIFTRHAIFPGDGSEINQLDKIYNVLGTPTRSEWPAISELQWYELLRPTQRVPSTFAEKYRDRVSSEAFELLQAMFLYDPVNRPTAADVLEHPYFTTEEPKPAQVVELADLEGDWHEFESKALRKEKEKQEKEARRLARDGEKRKAEEAAGVGPEAKKSEPNVDVEVTA